MSLLDSPQAECKNLQLRPGVGCFGCKKILGRSATSERTVNPKDYKSEDVPRR